MKKSISKIIGFTGALMLAGLLVAPVVRAQADDEAKKEKAAERKAKHEAEILKKYDKNGNGKLDPDETAALKADQEKAKEERKEKKEKKKEKEN